MKIYIGSDHGGFDLKVKIIEAFKDSYNVEDLGPYEFDNNDDYPDYALQVADAVACFEGEARGILICRSGNGVCIAANKVKKAYAALCFGIKHAEMAVIHDNANICCLDADYEGEDPIEIVKAFLEAKFEGGDDSRHQRRFMKVQAIESKFCS